MIENGFEVAPETLYELIGTIYRSSDAFVSNFDENYPTIAELADHIVTLSKKPGNVLLVDSIGKKKLGFLHIEPRGPHKLRHTSASIAITNGADVVSVAARLGHSDSSTTLRMYAHANEDSIRRVGQTVREALKQPEKKKAWI